MLRHGIAFILLLACAWLPGLQAQTSNAPPRRDSVPERSRPADTGVSSKQYVLSAGDVIHLKVYQEEDLETRSRVAQDGTVTLPLIGAVKVAGKTLELATREIRDLLEKDYLVNPQVSLGIVEYATRRFTVMGQVSRPGTYALPGEESLSLLQAIAMAGGATRIGNLKKVTVQRLERGQSRIYTLNVEDMAKKRDTQQFEIRPDDTISIPEKII